MALYLSSPSGCHCQKWSTFVPPQNSPDFLLKKKKVHSFTAKNGRGGEGRRDETYLTAYFYSILAPKPHKHTQLLR